MKNPKYMGIIYLTPPRQNMTDKTFEKWWEDDGRMYDPDTEDVPWFDKRKELAELAFAKGVEIGMARSRNYAASSAVDPDRIHFANGRIDTSIRGGRIRMTKKHFIALADCIRSMVQGETARVRGGMVYTDDVQRLLADFCQAQNPNFNRATFLGYIAGTCGPNGRKNAG